MNERDRIYLQILNFGLLSLRNASYGGNLEYWQIEADHLHNVPSLVGDLNERRHDYYFDAERLAYLKRIVDFDAQGIYFTLARYKELWGQLEELRADK